MTLGGGVAGDLGGFAAAELPARDSLRAGADHGVRDGRRLDRWEDRRNLAQGKNLVGAFHQPKGVFLDIATLRSLPRRERAARRRRADQARGDLGCAAFRLAGDADRGLSRSRSRGWCSLRSSAPARSRARSWNATNARAGSASCSISGIPSVTRSRSTPAIAASCTAKRWRLGWSSPPSARKSWVLPLPVHVARLESVLERAGLPTRAPNRPRSAYLSAIAVDKKKQGGKIHFVVLEGMGKSSTVALTPREILPAGWRAPRRGDGPLESNRRGGRTAWSSKYPHGRAAIAWSGSRPPNAIGVPGASLALAALGEGTEWPARLVFALAKLAEDEGARPARSWRGPSTTGATESGIASLDPDASAPESEEVQAAASAGDEDGEAGLPEAALDALAAPIGFDELERAARRGPDRRDARRERRRRAGADG